MSYTPNNASIYLAAFSGCLSGLNQAGLEAARIADAYAQELDTLWGVAGFTTLETTEIESLSESADLGVGLARATAVQGGDPSQWDSDTSVLQIKFTAVGGNLNTLTAGSLNVYLSTDQSEYP